jgi:L,D-transpeptidase catalytic domain
MRLLTAILAALLMAAPGASLATVTVTIDKGTQTMQVAEDGKPVWNWPVSTGTTDGHRTPNGNFRALWLDEKHASSKYENAPMPHSVFFTKLGHAIHGTEALSHLGRPASHGCVRLAPANAKKLFELVGRHRAETTIIIQGEEPASQQTAQSKSGGATRKAGGSTSGSSEKDLSRASLESYEVRYYRDRMEPGAD